MLMVELKEIPRYIHLQIKYRQRKHEDIIVDVLRSRKTDTTRIFIEDTPKGWWLALRIMMKGPSRLYRLVEVKELDLPSVLLKASLKRRWTPELEREVSKALRERGWLD